MRILTISLALFFVLGCGNKTKSTATADDLGREWISSYGAEDITAPNIDAIE